MTKNKNIPISLEGAKCIEIDEAPSSGDKVIDITETGDKVIETSVSSGKVIDAVVDRDIISNTIGETSNTSDGTSSFMSIYCPNCGKKYYQSYSRYCTQCGQKRK